MHQRISLRTRKGHFTLTRSNLMKLNRRQHLQLTFALACATSTALVGPTTLAQTRARLSEKPLKLVVSFAPGGPNDVMARVLAQRLSANLGQPVIVENKPGAGGVIGNDFVAKAPADGHTLLFASGPFVMAPALQAKMPYDTLKTFTGITKVAESPMVMMVPADSRFKTAKELIEFARQNPGKLNYGSGGIGSTPHLSTELLGTVTGAKLTHVPYKGGGESIKALMGGSEIDVLIDSITSTGPALASGRVKALAVTQNRRSEKLPDIPTFAELGFDKFAMTHWVGVVAPLNVPAEVLAQLRSEIAKALKSDDVVKRLTDLGAVPIADDSALFNRFIQDELKLWESVVKAANIQAQ
jgi:tripartite-type tricarboxylate transporter receptor subunit TctC